MRIISGRLIYNVPSHPMIFPFAPDGNYFGGYDFVNGDKDPLDDQGHGTHVAGTVSARKDGLGVVGAAPEVSLYALKALNASGSGNWSDVIAALQWAKDNAIQVTNNSYGSSSNPGTTVQAAFDNSYAAGVLHVAAAGNSGSSSGSGDNVVWPGRYGSVIAVAATDKTDKRASWSSTGLQVELAAPGVSINSTVRGDRYGLASGTSMASPHVAGTAALVIACGITDANGNGRINDEVRIHLQQTADDLGVTGRDTYYGFGLVNAQKAGLSCTITPNHTPIVSTSSPLNGSTFASGASILFQGTAADTEDGDLTASLTWTSSKDGAIGTGGSFLKVLSNGNHTITAAVTDSGGRTGTASVNITVGSSTVSVASITYSTNGGSDGKKHLSVTVALNPALSGASISARLNNTSTGQFWSYSGTTATDGSIKFSLNNAPSGLYTTTVTSVSALGYIWDGQTTANSFTK